MRFLRASFALALLLACGGAFAQAVTEQRAIEQQMTPDQFKAAGLDKLSATELANLNAWLNRTLETETAKASSEAKAKLKEETRGFWHFDSDEPIVSRITGDFRGFRKGQTYTLDNGQVWRQVGDETLAGVRRTNPAVKLSPGLVGNAWYISIDDYNTRAKVERIK